MSQDVNSFLFLSILHKKRNQVRFIRWILLCTKIFLSENISRDKVVERKEKRKRKKKIEREREKK